MDNMWMFYSVILMSVIQTQHVLGTGCNIVSVTSSSASTLNVAWSTYIGASVYLLDLRDQNSTNIAPVVVMQSAPNTKVLVQGLRPGHVYQVTLKVLQFYTVVCTDSKTAVTVPATSQITVSKAISSTSIRFEWSSVIGADSYILFVEELTSPPRKGLIMNQTFTTLQAQVNGLTPATVYNCYVYSSNSAGLGARSNIKTTMTLVQPPTGVTVVLTGKSTAHVTWKLVSKVLLYQVTVTADGKPNNAPFIRNTSASFMDINNLEPCSNYTVGVSSINVFLVPGDPNNASLTTPTIDPVMTVSANYLCSISTVTITWDSALGATLYRAMIVDSTGASSNCTSASISCQISTLKCSETYQVFVTAISGDCESTSNTPTSFETVPCAPANPHTLHDCSSNVIVFSWQPTNNTFYHVATAVDDTEETTECVTLDNTCYFTNVGCGQFYNYTVYGVGLECNSELSQPVSVQTAPCLPTNIKTTADCDSDTLITTWDSAPGALSYTVETQGNRREMYNCTTSSNNCTVTGVPCGEHLSVWIVASNQNCSTNKVLGEVAQTAPCSATNISVSTECSQDSATVTWTTGNGVIFYTAVAEDANGNSYTCYSLDSSCLIKGLRCGQNYTASVISTNLLCNSTSEEVTFITALCPPTNVTAVHKCAPDSVPVSWVASNSAKNYTAVAVSSGGYRSQCITNKTSCSFPGLQCGDVYTIGVSGADDHCTTLSNTVTLVTEPCAPTNVSSQLICKAGMAQVSWAPSVNTVNYTVKATSNGQILTCTSSSPNCILTNLVCGQAYNVQVSATDGTCVSNYSAPFRQDQVPCPPQNISTNLSCDTNSLTVSWIPSAVPLNYSVTAVLLGGNISSVTCHTSSTSCSLSGLQCGQTYNVSVEASSGSCSGPCSLPQTINTAPCSPQSLKAVVDCGTNSLLASWNASLGATTYTTTVTGPNDFYNICSSSNLTCSVFGLQCASQYNVSVASKNGFCTSSPSQTAVMTGPCDPLNVTSILLCGSGAAIVSWVASVRAVAYTVIAQDSCSQLYTSCRTNTTSCQLNQLQCGKVYNLTVLAEDATCNSTGSTRAVLMTAPCSPSIQNSTLNCGTDSATLSWKQVTNAKGYIVNATATSRHKVSCSSVTATCSLTDLLCNETYTATVIAQGSQCDSAPSSSTNFTTVPCAPSNVNASQVYSSNSTLVTWVGTATAVGYNVTATDQDGLTSYCYSNTTSCEVFDIQCGQIYNVIVTPYSKTCTGNPSAVYTFKAGLCATSYVIMSPACGSSTVSWSPVMGAEMYLAKATSNDGNTYTCSSNYSSSCNFTDLHCGQTYVVTVATLNRGSWSKPSPPVNLRTALCQPANLTGQVNCDTTTLTLMWSPVPMATYTLQAETISSTLHSSVYTAFNTSYTLTNLLCGQRYAFRIAAQDGNCSTSYSSPLLISTGPCQPSSINAIMDCQSQSATLAWQPSTGAVSYITKLRASSGCTASCATNYTTCQLSSLRCGEEYNVTVEALGETCNSTVQMAGFLTTEPCVPTNLSVNYNVSNAQVIWSAARGASSYSVQAVTDQGSTVTCNTTKNSCFLSGLQCSKIYNVTVMARNLACNNTVTSQPYLLMTEPCPPQDVQANIVCDQLTSTVSWQLSSLAVGYVAYFDDHNGHYTSCIGKSTDSICTVLGLTCGTVYNVWVKVLGQQYNSSASTVIPLTSAPCLPREVKVGVNCKSDGAALVSWNTTYGTANFSLTTVINGNLQTLCTTQQNSCNVTGLSCGETYSLSLTASNQQCSITVPMNTNLTTRPCPPQHVAVNLQCGSRTAVLSWDQSSNVELYVATAIKVSGGWVKNCNSTGSTCQFSDLDCGETYNFTVTAHSQGCCSQVNSTVCIQTEPCQPVIVSAQALCQNDSVQISWSQASGVVNYVTTATGNHGYVKIYNTTQTLLSATLPCGQDYNVTVQAQGSKCNSIPSSPAFFKTTPCIPHNVTTYVQCKFNMGSVSWGPSDGAKMYDVVATALDGHIHNCLTNTTSCTWNDLHCGEEYTVVVKAKDDNCTSLPSNSSVIYMSPCVPQNLVASVNCNMKVVSLSWDASNGTKFYTVSANAANKTTELTFNVTTANFSDLICGQNYSLRVTSHSQYCPGSSCATTYIQTWPCPPSGVSTMQDCLSGIAMATWQASNGSDYYTATMQTGSGFSKVCTSNSNACSIPDLTCGYNFSVSVTASNKQCNTTSSQTTSLMSVPCVPTNVSVVMSCANNTAVVSWSASRSAVQYSVVAHSCHSNISCLTSDLSCRLDNLTCGSQYTVQVVAIGNNCSSIPSQALMFNSVPCPPRNVSAQVSCSSNDMMISWNAITDADHFLVSVISLNGAFSKSCNTTNTSCSIRNMTCGNTFTVQVTSVRGNCSSQQSQTQSILSAPCQPQGITGNLDCVTNSAWISWGATPGADSYTVTAVDGEDNNANCTTSTNTSCEIKDLACGVLYNFSVIAKNIQCESQPSATINLQTALCSSSNITVLPQCYSSSILVEWELMKNGNENVVYTARAEGSDRTHLTCNSTGTSCYLDGAQCDFYYTIIVHASTNECSNTRSLPSKVYMEPCPPKNVMVNTFCADHNALVSWTPSPIAETYRAIAMGVDGQVHTCNTTSNNCSFSRLQCSQQYTVFVTASNANCSSKASGNATLNTGLCPPDGLSVTLYCNNHSALLSWTSRDNAVHYYGCAQALNGDKLYCHSTKPTCIITGLDCGTVYNFTVQASDGTCNSSLSQPVQRGAAPCPPESVAVQLLPVQKEIQVMRFNWTQTSCRDTEYLLTLTGSLLGNNQTLFEISSYWTNRTYFEIPLPCSSSYVATVQSRNAGVTSNPSVSLNGTTAPCPPAGVLYGRNSSFGTVSWNASVFATTYTVYDNSVTPKVLVCNTPKLSCSVSSIAPTNLLITASNSAGESEAENVTNVVIQNRRRRDLSEEMPEYEGLSAPLLDVIQGTSTVFFVEWSQVDAASHYSLVIRKQGSSSKPRELTVYEKSIIITDLSPDSTYCFSVSARNSDTSGPESEPVCVQTGQGLTL